MPRGKRIKRSDIHEQLWAARNRKDCVKIHQKTFATFIGTTGPNMCEIIKDLSEQKRIKKIAARKGNIGIYLVRDPAEFDESGKMTGIAPA